MKVLWFTNTPCSASEKFNDSIIGGGWLSSLEKELSRIDGIELHIVFYYSKKIEPFTYNDTHFYPVFRKYSNTKVQRYLTRLFRFENNDTTEIKQLCSVVELIKPDLIHIHGTEENFGLIQKYSNIPTVISIQGLLNPIRDRLYSGIPKQIASKYRSFRSVLLVNSPKYKFRKFKINSAREGDILKISKNIIGRTDWDRRVTRVLSPESRYFTGQEMLRSVFYQNEWSKTKFNDTIQIVTTTSDGLYKGFETIVKTCMLLNQIPSFSYHWTVIGLTNESEIVKITKKWLNVNLSNLNISLIGKKNEGELIEIFINADIYCQVSHIENSSNSLCEAMKVGLPCIASHVGGTDTILENKKEGVLIQDGDAYSFAGTIYELSKDFDHASKYGKTAKEKAMERHASEKIVSDLILTYQSIINEPQK